MENFDQAGAVDVSDEDDLRLFASLDDPQLAKTIIRIKKNDPGAHEIHICPIRPAHERVWRRLGHILRLNTTVKSFTLVSPYDDDDAAFLFDGIRNNRSMEVVDLYGIDLRAGATAALDKLAPHLIRNPSLKKINLCDCNLGSAGIETISRALSDRSEDTLEELYLDDNHIPDADLEHLVLALSGKRSFGCLSLSRCEVGVRGCTSLAKLLENDESNLEVLRLDGNSINDKAVIVLANSLARNTKLKELQLSYNRKITGNGLSAILKLVCNSNSSIDDLVGSNHTLGDIRIPLDDLTRTLGVDDANLLRASLMANTLHSKISATRQKAIWSHARGDLNLGASSIATGAMPRVMAWIGGSLLRWIGGSFESSWVQYHDPPLPEARLGAVKLDALYRVVRSVPIGEAGEWNRERQPPRSSPGSAGRCSASDAESISDDIDSNLREREFGRSGSSVSSRSSYCSFSSSAFSASQCSASDNESIPDDLSVGQKEIWPDLCSPLDIESISDDLDVGLKENRPDLCSAACKQSVPSDLGECQKEIRALRRENLELHGKNEELRGEILSTKMKLLKRMVEDRQSLKRRRIDGRGA